MFNNISSISSVNNSQSTTNMQNPTQKDEQVSVFGNEIVKSEPILTKEEKKALQEKIKTTPDGIIQRGKQGQQAGDCWLLSQMNSMAKTDWGKEAFKNGISSNEDGSFTVHFKGVNQDITISAQEFKKAQKNREMSSGDADALLYEVAVEKYFKENDIREGSIKGNSMAGKNSLQYLLTGVEGRETSNLTTVDVILKSMAQNPENNSNIAATYVYLDKGIDKEPTNHVVSIQKVHLNEKGNVKTLEVVDSYYPDQVKNLRYNDFKYEMIRFGYIQEPKN